MGVNVERGCSDEDDSCSQMKREREKEKPGEGGKMSRKMCAQLLVCRAQTS